MLDVLQPLKCSKKIRKPGGEVTEVTFKYEKLSTFCYICVLLGYNDDHCDKIFEMADDGGVRLWGLEIKVQSRTYGGNNGGSRWLKEEGSHGSNVSRTVGGNQEANPINCGAIIAEDKKWDEMVIRDANINFLATRTLVHTGALSIAEAEALALLAAINWTMDKGYNNIVFETNCKHVHDLILSTKRNISDLGLILATCKNKLINSSKPSRSLPR